MNHDLIAVQLAASALDLLEGSIPLPPPNLNCDDAAHVIVSMAILCGRLTRLAAAGAGIPPEAVLQNFLPASPSSS